MNGARPRLVLGCLTVLALLAQGCGSAVSGPSAVLSSATSNIGAIRAGELSVRFALTPNAAPSDTVGVVINGAFALDRRHRLPILHVKYTRLAGARSATVEIDSNGQSATMGGAGGRVPLTAQQEQLFSATLQGPQGLGNLPLHLDRWVGHPRQAPGPPANGQRTDLITGTVDLPNALSDLNQLTGGQVTQAARSASINATLSKTLRSSSFVAVVGRKDHLLRRLDLRAVLVPVGSATTGRPTQGLTINLRIALAPRSLPR